MNIYALIAVVDAFAAMTSARSYSEALSFEEATEEMRRGAGKQFDPRLAEVFCSAIETTTITSTSKSTRR